MTGRSAFAVTKRTCLLGKLFFWNGHLTLLGCCNDRIKNNPSVVLNRMVQGCSDKIFPHTDVEDYATEHFTLNNRSVHACSVSTNMLGTAIDVLTQHLIHTLRNVLWLPKGAKTTQLEIWPQRPRYFAAASHRHTSRRSGGGGFDFGPYLVDDGQGGIHGGRGQLNQRSRCSRNHWSSILLRAFLLPGLKGGASGTRRHVGNVRRTRKTCQKLGRGSKLQFFLHFIFRPLESRGGLQQNCICRLRCPLWMTPTQDKVFSSNRHTTGVMATLPLQ